MKNLKEQKGITLVALVVTIIVLLILAGVTILYVLSDDGIFGTAQRAGTETDDAYVREVLMTAVLQAQTDYYDAGATDRKVTNASTALTFVKGELSAAGITGTSLTCDSFCDPTDGTSFGGSVSYKEVTYNVSYDTAAGTPFSVEKQ